MSEPLDPARPPEDIPPAVRAPAHLGLASAEAFRTELERILAALPIGGGRIVVDVSATQGADSVGLHTLLMMRRRAGDRDITLRLVGLNERLRTLLLRTKLLRQFEYEA